VTVDGQSLVLFPQPETLFGKCPSTIRAAYGGSGRDSEPGPHVPCFFPRNTRWQWIIARTRRPAMFARRHLALRPTLESPTKPSYPTTIQKHYTPQTWCSAVSIAGKELSQNTVRLGLREQEFPYPPLCPGRPALRMMGPTPKGERQPARPAEEPPNRNQPSSSPGARVPRLTINEACTRPQVGGIHNRPYDGSTPAIGSSKAPVAERPPVCVSFSLPRMIGVRRHCTHCVASAFRAKALPSLIRVRSLSRWRLACRSSHPIMAARFLVGIL